jgi:hypothetical protein
MTELSVTKTTGAAVYGSPFVGPVNHTAAIDVDLTGLTSDEIDAKGYLKPGVPLSRAGALIAALTRSTPGTPAYTRAGTSDGVIGSVVGRFGAPAETITATCITEDTDAGTFRVEGSVSGFLGIATVAVAFDSPVIGFTIADGAEDWDIGDVITIPVTGGVQDKVFGVVPAPTKVAADNAVATIAALGTVPVVLALIGAINRDVVEDHLGRALTAAEVAGFAGTPVVLL